MSRVRIDLAKVALKRSMGLRGQRYIPVTTKFWIAQAGALSWVALSVRLSLRWLEDLACAVGFPLALFLICFIAYVPGYLNAFLGISLLLDRQPQPKDNSPDKPVTVLVAAYNEARNIAMTLRYIARQDYRGAIKVVLADNGSTDGTAAVAQRAAMQLDLPLQIVHEQRRGKNFALNAGLEAVDTEYFATLDADTLLHRSALRYIVARIESSPQDVCAVAGHVLVRNSRDNFWTKIQEWDYFLGIASVKRAQGLYQGTLVAQGAFSLFKTRSVREVGGWPNAIGEDIVLSWKLLGKGYRIYFEPRAIAFTASPSTWRHFSRQRARWARGMLEGIGMVRPWWQPRLLAKFLTGIDLLIPVVDLVFTLAWIPGMVLAFFGKYYIVGPYTLLVLPLNLALSCVMYLFQRSVFDELGLRIRRNRLGFAAYFLLYQLLMSPVAVWGYIQEILHFKRVWR